MTDALAMVAVLVMLIASKLLEKDLIASTGWTALSAWAVTRLAIASLVHPLVVLMSMILMTLVSVEADTASPRSGPTLTARTG